MANSANIRPFIQKWEGGLSKALSDTASSNPSPWSYNGVSGYHTNKGVTYSTFKNLSNSLGYANTAENFFSMPNDIWNKIFSNGYWKPLYLDNLNSQAIADALSNWSWGSGVSGAFTSLKKYLFTKNITVTNWPQSIEALNKLSSLNETAIFLELINWREQFFKSLNQPANLRGWLNRLNEMKAFGLETIKKKSIG